MPEVAYVHQLPDVHRMLEGVPADDRPDETNRAEFWHAVALELAEMIRYAAGVRKPEIVMAEMRKAESQYVWEFWVNDLSLPRANAMNWHGQNTSQWLYAGAIVLENGKVSRHH